MRYFTRSLTPFFVFIASTNLQALSLESDIVQIMQVEPGKSYPHRVILKNEKDSMVRVKIQSMDYQQQKGLVNPLQPVSLDRSNAAWIEVLSEVELAPHSSAPVPFKINVPIDAKDGSYWSLLTFTPLEAAPVSLSVEIVTKQETPARLKKAVILKSTGIKKTREGIPYWEVCIQNTENQELALSSSLELRALNHSSGLKISGQTHQIFPKSETDYIFSLEDVASGIYDAIFTFSDQMGNSYRLETTLTL